MKRVTRRYGGGRVVEAVRVLVQVAHLLWREELGGEIALGHVERHLNAHQLVQQSHVLDHLHLRPRGSQYAHERGEAEGELRHVHVLLLRLALHRVAAIRGERERPAHGEISDAARVDFALG